MPQVDVDSYDWTAADVTVNTNDHSTSSAMASRVIKRSETIQTQYSTSSCESRYLDDRSTPSPDFNDESQEQSSSINETAPNFLTFRLDRSYARRKISTCPNISSTNSTCLSIDGGISESETNSSCYSIAYVPGGINKYDDIIDKIVELRFSQKNLNVEAKNSSVSKNKRKDDDNFSKSSENLQNSSSEDQILENKAKIKSDFEADDVNGNYKVAKNKRLEDYNDNDKDNGEHEESDSDDDNNDDDNDLVERGPVRPHCNNQSHHDKPYTLDWLADTSENNDQNQLYMSDYYSTAEKILRNKQFSEKLNPCLDKLSDYGQSDQIYFHTDTSNRNISSNDKSNTSIPSIVLNDPGETALLQILASGGFQAAQTLSDTTSIPNPSPTTTNSENWPDSPASSYNVLSSRSHSRASSRAQSPGSSINIGSPTLHLNMVGSPPESQANIGYFRVGQALSSSESSNHSFSDTPSPSNYQCSVDQKIEEELGLDFGSFNPWCQSYMSSDTVVNSTETIDAIDNNELQLIEEVIRGDQIEKKNKMTYGVQVVPKSISLTGDYQTEAYSIDQTCENDLLSSITKIHENCGQRRTTENISDDSIRKPESHGELRIIERHLNPAVANLQQNQVYLPANVPQLGNKNILMNTSQNHIVCPNLDGIYDLAYSEGMQSDNLYSENPVNSAQSLMDFENSMDNFLASHYAESITTVISRSTNDEPPPIIDASVNSSTVQPNDLTPINKNRRNYFDKTPVKLEQPSKSTFNEFQMPETVSSYRQNRYRRTSERNIAPWPSLNLPLTGASERLKGELDPREVERAMKNLLKKPTEKLAAGDEDGDTMLMCLVGNCLELEKKKAYLVPLVERLGSLSGALTMTNNRSEDALYLAAMNCPQISYVTGYLAAAMLQRGIDVSQKLYHTRGDTLIHAIASKGDTHGSVLAELLSLRTLHGNSIFDLSKRNYDGRTPLHVAIGSHDPRGSGVSCIGMIRLMLENGADQTIKETKCGDTALHMAISLYCDPALVKTLLNNNGHEAVNVPNYNNNTPVHMACALSKAVSIERQMEVCMDLIRAGGLTDVQNRQGKTPLALVSAERKETFRRMFHKKV